MTSCLIDGAFGNLFSEASKRLSDIELGGRCENLTNNVVIF